MNSPIPLRTLENRTKFVSGLYGDLMESGIRYFFPGATLERIEESPSACPAYWARSPAVARWNSSGWSGLLAHRKLETFRP